MNAERRARYTRALGRLLLKDGGIVTTADLTTFVDEVEHIFADDLDAAEVVLAAASRCRGAQTDREATFAVNGLWLALCTALVDRKAYFDVVFREHRVVGQPTRAATAAIRKKLNAKLVDTYRKLLPEEGCCLNARLKLVRMEISVGTGKRKRTRTLKSLKQINNILAAAGVQITPRKLD